MNLSDYFEILSFSFVIIKHTYEYNDMVAKKDDGRFEIMVQVKLSIRELFE